MSDWVLSIFTHIKKVFKYLLSYNTSMSLHSNSPLPNRFEEINLLVVAIT